MIQSRYFAELTQSIFNQLAPGESLNLSLSAESSHFIRWNTSKIRQSGTVQDATLSLDYIRENPATGGLKRSTASITLQNAAQADLDRALSALQWLRDQTHALPDDPYVQKPRNLGSSQEIRVGHLLDTALASEAIVSPLKDLDMAGIYASGRVIVAMTNSAGQAHWFETENFSLDYSLYTPQQKAVKGTYAGQKWNPSEYEKQITQSRTLLELMNRAPKKIKPGSYRTYLAPAAFLDIIGILSWGGISEGMIRQKLSPFLKVRKGEKKLSPLFSLTEDFRSGMVPRFNEEGEVSPEYLPLIQQGVLKNTLISPRTALEYSIASNGASGSEGLRSPSVTAGTLPEKDVLAALGTGLYLSNLHYLNWSDQVGGRITGMTRYACFWVEDGKIIAPIENLRWDESVFHFLGDGLEALTQERSTFQEVGTYERRWLGSAVVPGALLKSLTFTN